jgi:signal transduction histidine kinase
MRRPPRCDPPRRRRLAPRRCGSGEELIQAEKMAALGTLVAGVAHELGNPANFISLNAPLIRGFWEAALPVLDAHEATTPDFTLAQLPYAQVREVMPQLLDGMTEGTERIRRIIADLRAFARPDDDRQHGPQDINAITRSALAITRHAVAKATRHLVTDFGCALPPVRGGFQRLQQALVNLLLNACQALTGVEQAIHVSTAWDVVRRRVVVTIADAGCGIPPERMRHLGEPFSTTKRGRGGTGLGLAVSRRIIADHHGELLFTSAPGRGTRASVLLPGCMESEHAGRRHG